MVGIRQFDEETVLADALLQFWRKGFAATSMQELAAVTGVQRGSLYNAYGGKEGLFIAAYRHYQSRYLAGVRQALSAADLKTALHDLFEFCIHLIRHDNRGCLTTKAATDEGASSPAIRDALRQQLSDLHACLAERLAQSAQQLRLSVDETAALLVTHTRGMVVMERIFDDPQQLIANADALIQLLVAE